MGVEIRKLKSQFTKWELGYLEHVILPKAKVVGFTKHCVEQMKERGITYTVEDFNKDVCMDNVIHIGKKDGKFHILFRSKKVVKGTEFGNSNVVFALGYNGNLLTTWYNNEHFHHDNLNMARYDAHASVKKLFGKGWKY